MYMWYVFRVCDDRDMSLKTSLTHIALTTAFVDATACESAQNQKINYPRHRETDTSPSKEVEAPQHVKTPSFTLRRIILRSSAPQSCKVSMMNLSTLAVSLRLHNRVIVDGMK